MPASKTTRGSKKKRPSKAQPRFYVLKTAQAARTGLISKLEAYKQKFIAQPMESGRSLVAELKAEPRKTVTNLMDEGKARIVDMNKDARIRIDGIKKESHVFLTKAGKSPRETFDRLLDDSKTFVDDLSSSTKNKLEDFVVDLKIIKTGVEKDSRMVMDDILNGSKKALDKVPGKRRIEKELMTRVEAIPGKLNLPSKRDIEHLARQVKALNTKVNKLIKTPLA